MSTSEKPDQIQASVAAALSRLRGDVPSAAQSDEPQGEQRPRPANDVRGDPFFRTIQSSAQGARAPIPMTPFPRMQAPQEPTPSDAPSEEASDPTTEPSATIEIPEMPERSLAPDLVAMPEPRASAPETSQPSAPPAAPAMQAAAPQPPAFSSNNPFARVMRGTTPQTASDPAQRDLLAELPPPPISEPLRSSDVDTDASAMKRRRRNRRLLAMAAVIVVLAIGAWLWKGGTPSTEVPVITADATPEKVKPADEGGLQVQNQDVQVLDPSTQTQGETVMPEPEQPMTPPAETAPGDTTSSEQAPAVVENGAQETSPTVTAQAPAVEAPETQAPAVQAPTVQAPAVDAPPAPETPLSSVPLPSMEENGGTNAAPAAPATSTPQPTQTAETPAVAEQAPAPAPATTEPAAAPAPEPAQAAQPEQPAAQPAQTQEAAVTPTVPAGSVRIQLAAGKSEASVQKEWAALQKAHPNLLGSLSLNIEKVDKGSAGIFYRLQAGPLADKAAARKLCASLKQQNQDCIVVAK